MSSTGKEVAKELLPLVRVYKDGSVERLLGSPYMPPSPDQGSEARVLSKDITISEKHPAVSTRLYLPKDTQPNQKLPILVYFHYGGFCAESAFSFLHHRYLNILVSQAQVVAVSVEYRLAPEHFLPAAYEDSGAALKWVASHKIEGVSNKEPWLSEHGDFERHFIGGDSAGANVVHYIAMQAGEESLRGDVKVLGAFLSYPYFWGSKPIGSEPSENREKSLLYLIWDFVYPLAPGGIDDPMINPVGPGKPRLSKLGCSKLLVCVAEKDQLRDRGVWYFDAVKESGFRGEMELFEIEGEDHVFQIFIRRQRMLRI